MFPGVFSITEVEVLEKLPPCSNPECHEPDCEDMPGVAVTLVYPAGSHEDAQAFAKLLRQHMDTGTVTHMVQLGCNQCVEYR